MRLTRREFIGVSAATSAAVLTGCATNPVTGRKQLMLVSEAAEVDTDRKWSPHQFSANYGAVQDPAVNAYLTQLGTEMAVLTHRPAMPYNFRVLNMVDVNAYTFPAGSMGFGRALLVGLDDESQLAAVIGHELGHVNARHNAQLQTSGILAQIVVAGVAAYVENKKGNDAAALVAGLGGIGANLLLCKYSRTHERQADALGMEYMARANYNPEGMVGVMDVFRKMQKEKPSTVEVLFSTHPMSDERYETARKRIESSYAYAKDFPRNRERYMDQTAGLRKQKAAIEDFQKGEALLGGGKAGEAEAALKQGLARLPDDYAGLLIMAKCCMVQKRMPDAQRYAEQAKAVYPNEPQATHVLAMVQTGKGDYAQALASFDAYEKALPGNPNTIFQKGFCHEKMGHKKEAAGEYLRYNQAAPGGEYAGHAQSQLVKWGYAAPQP